jgi:hypothetical protein
MFLFKKCITAKNRIQIQWLWLFRTKTILSCTVCIRARHLFSLGPLLQRQWTLDPQVIFWENLYFPIWTSRFPCFEMTYWAENQTNSQLIKHFRHKLLIYILLVMKYDDFINSIYFKTKKKPKINGCDYLERKLSYLLKYVWAHDT